MRQLWLWRRHRKYPRVVARPVAPRVLRLRPNDGMDRDYERRVAAAIGAARRAETRGRP